MKFYRDKDNNNNNWFKIVDNKLTAIYFNLYYLGRVPFFYTKFYKNGKLHNSKNSSCINCKCGKEFCLNGVLYGYAFDFTKESWRRFCKLKVFL
jgi:hypothetical protein